MDYELFEKISGTDNRISTARAYAERNTSDIQSIQIDDTKMGKAAEGNGGFREERAASKFPKNRSRKTENICGRASRRIPVGDGGGVWM